MPMTFFLRMYELTDVALGYVRSVIIPLSVMSAFGRDINGDTCDHCINGGTTKGPIIPPNVAPCQ